MDKNPNIEINTFILCAAFRKESVFGTYKKLCDFHPNEKIDFVDFEWKYYQYYHRNRDLTIERSPENSSTVALSNLPIDVLEKIVGRLDLVNCLVLRKVSRNFRRLVDTSELHCDRFYFHYGDRASTIEIDRLALIYKHTEDGGCEVVSERNQIIKEYKDDRDFEKVMLADIATFLKNPRLRIGRFDFMIYDNDACIRFLRFFKSLNFQLDVRSVDIDTEEETFWIMCLDCLKPATLEAISFDAARIPIREFHMIADTEQWKRAVKFRCRRLQEAIWMERMVHLKEIRIDNIEFSGENLIIVRDVLLKSAHIESCWLGVADFQDQDDFDVFWDLFDDDDDEDVEDVEEENIIRIMAQNAAFNPETSQFWIPNSRDHFQLEFEKDHRDLTYALKITKNKEE